MKEDNHLVQNLALAFGERVVAEFCYNELRLCLSGIHKVLDLMVRTYLSQVVLDNLSWFLIHNTVNLKAGEDLRKSFGDCVREIHGVGLGLVNSFGIPEHLLTAPIAQDYEDYNSRPNGGEVYRARL